MNSLAFLMLIATAYGLAFLIGLAVAGVYYAGRRPVPPLFGEDGDDR